MYGNASGGLTLTSYSGVMANSNSGASVVPDDHANSLLWQRVNNGEMPPGNNPDLSSDEINLIAQWIDEGALEVASDSTSIEGRWLLEQYSNTMYEFDGDVRLTYLCNADVCDSTYWNS